MCCDAEGASSLPQHEEPVLGAHPRERRDRVVEEVESGDECPRIAEPCRAGVGWVAWDDVAAAAFDDRDVGRQEPLDGEPREEPALLVDGMPQPGV